MGALFSSRFLALIAGIFVLSSGLSYFLANKGADSSSTAEGFTVRQSDPASMVDPDVAIDQALEYSVNGIYSKSFPILKSLADRNVTRAKLYLGVAYYHGHGVKSDRGKARALFMELLDKDYESGIVRTYLSLIGYSDF